MIYPVQGQQVFFGALRHIRYYAPGTTAQPVPVAPRRGGGLPERGLLPIEIEAIDRRDMFDILNIFIRAKN